MLRTAATLCALTVLSSAGSAMAATGEIHGKVTNHLGEPIAGITVCAKGSAPLVGTECDLHTDGEGEYSISGLKATGYDVAFNVEGNPSLNYVPQWYDDKAHPEEADPISLAEGESREIDAQMQTGGEFRGTVSSRATGLPVEGVRVCAQALEFLQTGEIIYCGRSNAAGEFTVKNLGTGRYRLEFRTEGHVNYVEELLPEAPGSISLAAGEVVEVEAHLVPGVEIEGTLTKTGTVTPIDPVAPIICALNPATQARVKCAFPAEPGGQYAIPGLPAGGYVVSFAVDNVEEGLDLHPDGYVRRYWQEVPSFNEATTLVGTSGAVFDEIDAVLTPGEEVFPNCEVRPGCPPSPLSNEIPSADGAVTPTVTLPQAKPPSPPLVRRPRCKRGLHRVGKGAHTRCVRASKRHKHSPLTRR